jgi:hypothetical protein
MVPVIDRNRCEGGLLALRELVWAHVDLRRRLGVLQQMRECG